MGGKVLILACQDDGIGAATLGQGDILEHIAPKKKKGKKKVSLRSLNDLLSLILTHYRQAHLHNQNTSVPVILGTESTVSSAERQDLLRLIREENFYLIHDQPFELESKPLGDSKKSSVLARRKQQFHSLIDLARNELNQKLEAGENLEFWIERAALLDIRWTKAEDVIQLAESSEVEKIVDSQAEDNDLSDTMPETIQPKTTPGLPSIRDVFELRQPLPPSHGRPSFWRVEGVYILGRQSKILHGLTDGEQAQ
ncbi:MAG: hypothetical protein AAFQ68_21010 [Bacteroidota bacterium]